MKNKIYDNNGRLIAIVTLNDTYDIEERLVYKDDILDYKIRNYFDKSGNFIDSIKINSSRIIS